MIFDNRTLSLVNLLITNQNPLSIDNIMSSLNISKRSAAYLIKKANESMEYLNLGRIHYSRGKGYFITTEQKRNLEKKLGVIENIKRVLSPEQRIYYIICICMYPRQNITIKLISDYCATSRNTTINDIKIAAEKLKSYRLTLKYIQNRGYRISGESIQKKAILFFYLRKLIENYSYHQIDLWDEEQIHLYHNRLREIEKILQIKYTKGTLTTISIFLSLIQNSDERYTFNTLDFANIANTKELKLVDEYFYDINVHDRVFLTIHLLGYRCDLSLFEKDSENKNLEIYNLAEIIVNNFENLSGIVFKNHADLINSIYFHLMLTTYLYRFAVQIINPFIKDIKNKLIVLVHFLLYKQVSTVPTLNETL